MYDLVGLSVELWVAGIAQTIMVTAVGITLVAILIRQKNNTLYRLMLVIAISTLLQNAGYLQELRSRTTAEALAGLRIEYIGGAFAATLFLALVLLYCGYTIPKKLFTFLVSVDVLVVASVWTCEFNPLYYTSVSFDADAAIPHVLLGKGVLYIAFAAMNFAQLIASLVITLHALCRIKDSKKRRNYTLLLFSSIFPMTAYFIGLVSAFRGFDAIPIGVGLGMISLASAVLFHHAFDLVATAHENIIKELDEAVLIVDEHYNFAEANGRARSLFGTLIDYMKKTKAEDGKLSFLFQLKQDSELEIEGRIYRVHRNEIFVDKMLIGYVLILFDITEERRQFENMQRLKEAADSANEAKSNFLAHVSHEIRTPINAVLGMNEMILRESAEQETLKYAKDIKNAARTLLSIINDILDFSKLESGKMELVPAEYTLSTLLSDVYNMIIVKANDKQLKLHFEIDPLLPSVFKGDDIRIRQILLNLLTNAVKYTNKGSVTLTVSCVEINPEMTEAAIKFEVSDTGIGIRKENLPHLYEAFERIDLNRNRGVEGTGLGMSIVIKFLKLMDSSLQVDSTYGKGSVFSFELTQQVLDTTPIADFKQNQQPDNVKGYEVSFVAPKARVLVVDDNETNRAVFSGLLRQTQVRIFESESGLDCLDLVQKEHFDVIFMDDMMPGMTGRETLQEMQNMENNQCADTPVVMLTANAIHGEKEKYLALGFSDFLVKPIDPEQLEAMLGRLLPASLVRWSVAELDHRAATAEETSDSVDSDMSLLEQIDGLNINYAKLHLPGDALLVQTARSFCETIPQEISHLQQLIDCVSEEEYLTDYRIRVHSIKSSAATIGITELSGIASLSEGAARSKNLNKLQMIHPILLDQLEIYHQRLNVLVKAKENTKTSREPANMVEILPLLDLLCQALKDRDFDAADLLMEKLDGYSYPPELQEKMNLLQSQVMNLEADRACITAEEILQQS